MKRPTKFTVLSAWKVTLTDIGISPSHACQLAGLPVDLFTRTDKKLTPDEYFALFSAFEDLVAPKPLALELMSALSVEAFDPPLFAGICSPNLNVALQRLSEFKPLIGPLVLDVNVGTKVTTASIDCYGFSGDIPRSLGVCELAFFTQLARMATRTNINPCYVQLTQLPEDCAAYEAFFGCPLVQGNSNRIDFLSADARAPFLTENSAMWDFFEPGLKQRLSDVTAQASVAERLKSVLLEMLPSGVSAAEQAASRLAMSKRSLQRKLNEEGVSYQIVLNQTRQELAEFYLRKPGFSSGEIAYLLGFQDTNSFYRAFNSWMGTTPETYRNQLRQ